MIEESLTLQKMQVISWFVLAVLTLGSAVIVSPAFALAVLVGGIISICSFWVSHNDVMRVITSVTSLPSLDERKAQAQQGQKGYLLKFWIRIVIIGIVLLVIIKSQAVNIFGLILGLSTVVFAITFISLNVVRHYFFRGRR
ncbi:MAG: hypothetical protein ACD_75C01344G0003 [uncultured bacterium]|nr:MAG: hypothetical protein ACD_75C01344G0003 [uncultured bacterium]HBG21286.1 hypothetical protein [Desulfobulbaceae bacterium]